MWRAAQRIPAPLGALLVVTALVGMCWALVVPAWQAPDENAHFAYAQSLAERFSLPGGDRQQQSSEQLIGADATESDQVAANPVGRPPWSAAAETRWREKSTTDAERRDGGGPNPAGSNPPLYYLYAAGAYRLADGGDVFTRLYVQRLAGVFWLLLTVTATWLLAGELFSRQRSLQFVAAAVAGLIPMVSFVSASISPDTMLYALWSIALWLAVRMMRRGATTASASALFAVVAAAILVKATSYALLPAAVVALGVGLRRSRYPARHVAAVSGATFLAIAVPLAVWWAVARGADRGAAEQIAGASTEISITRLRAFASYLWQFYLPAVPGMIDFGTIGVWDVWVKGAFGRFGWLEVTLPDWLYAAVAVASASVAVALVTFTWKRRHRLDRPVVLVLVLAAATLLVGLHWTDFTMREAGTPFMQGRYVLPLVSLAGVAVAAAIAGLPRDARPPVIGLALGGLLVTQFVSLATTLTRFYA